MPQSQKLAIIGSPRSPDRLRYCDKVSIIVGPNFAGVFGPRYIRPNAACNVGHAQLAPIAATGNFPQVYYCLFEDMLRYYSRVHHSNRL